MLQQGTLPIYPLAAISPPPNCSWKHKRQLLSRRKTMQSNHLASWPALHHHPLIRFHHTNNIHPCCHFTYATITSIRTSVLCALSTFRNYCLSSRTTMPYPIHRGVTDSISPGLLFSCISYLDLDMWMFQNENRKDPRSTMTAVYLKRSCSPFARTPCISPNTVIMCNSKLKIPERYGITIQEDSIEIDKSMF